VSLARTGAAAASLIAAALLVSGCAGAAPNRFIRRAGSGPIEVELPGAAHPVRAARAPAVAVPRPSPPPAVPLPTVESTHPELGASLAALRTAPTAAAHLRVGLAYQRALVLDLAMEHFDDAIRMDPRMAAAYDARARVWRDWGLLGPAVGDANRAVFFAPRSAGARNTLGIILGGLGDRAGAARAYRCAAQLDPAATWPRTNLGQLGDVTPLSSADCTRGKAPRS
jgi:tetratricopeptide (TPR) repeat protein